MFTVSAGGTGIGGRTDQLHFVHQPVSGDTNLIVRIDSLIPADPASKVGLMLRESLDGGSRHAFIYVDASNRTGFARRATPGARNVVTPGANRTAPVWLALRRQGQTLSGYVSSDGSNWELVGSDTLSTGQTLYAGIAVTASSSQQVLTDVSKVSVDGVSSGDGGGSSDGGGSGGGTGGGSTGGGGVLPQNQVAADIGSPSPSGSTRESSGTYTISAGGRDVGGHSDQFHFVYQQVTGDLDIRARVQSIQAVTSSSKAGVMIRGDLSSWAAYSYTMLSAGSGYGFERRDPAGSWFTPIAGGAGSAPGWVRLLRRGARVESYRSTDGQDWTLIDGVDTTLPEVVYVGIAVTSRSDGTATTAIVDNLSVSAPRSGSGSGGTGQNAPPTVSVTAPRSGQSWAAPATVTISADASDPEGRLARVEFFVNDFPMGADTTAPYGMTWSEVPSGSYTVTAIAFDAEGQQTRSSGVPMTVGAQASNQPPSVALTSPAQGQTLSAPANMTVSANASDPEGRMARVDFYANNNPIGSDTTAPYTITWSSVGPGDYSITAVAHDADGLQTASSSVLIAVRASGGGGGGNQPPTVALTSPTDGQSFSSGASITFRANAADPEGRLTRVEFVSGFTTVNTDTTAPFEFVWTGVPNGTYGLTAIAFDADGGRTVSGSVTVTVSGGGVVIGPNSWRAVFTASSDHVSNVNRYQLNIYQQGADPNTANPLVTSDLGKPTPDGSMTISVDRTSVIQALSPGPYVATVTAIGPGGSTQSLPHSFSR